MKTTFTLLITLLLTFSSLAQNGINYKAVIKDGAGNILESESVSVQFNIYEGAALTNNVYQEIHGTVTDENGIIILNIGEGGTGDDFSAIAWENDDHFLNVRVNIGAGLVDMGTTQFKVVPYALVAKDVENKVWETNNTNAFYNEGNVGIGTDVPTTKFEIVGSGTNSTAARITSPNGTSSLQLFHPDTSITDWSINSGVITEDLQISSSNNSQNGQVRLRLKPNGDIIMAQNDGRVGIGTFSPVNPFSVLQPTGTANTVRIESQSHPTGKDLLELRIPSGSTSGSQFIEMENGSSIVAAVNGDGSARFTKMGVGNNNATGKLHIFQNSQIVGTGLRFTDGTTNDDWDITHGFGLRFHNGGTLKGFISANTGAYTVGSDINLKSGIQNIPSVLNRVEQLRPTTYYYKDDTSKTKALGFIAQEVNTIFPEVVNFSKADDLYGIDYAAFGVIAIKAIQEQQTIIKEQQKQIDELKTLVLKNLNKN